MSVYLKPILTACYLFPILAAVFTLPYIINQYHKYGALLMLRVVIVYSFIFYMITSYFMTILPLPPIDSVTASSASVLLTPFDALTRLKESSGLSLHDPSTYRYVLSDSNFYQIVFNILLLLPFGVYLRYYFNRKWYQVLILSFLYSSFFELTQLSGLYGIYPYPYRYFEVDDLICNTFGGMLGFWITPALLFFLPGRERLDEMSYAKGEHVSAYRRLLAFLVDFLVMSGIYAILVYFIQGRITFMSGFLNKLILFPITAYVCMVLSMSLTGGYTIGKYLVKIRLTDESGGKLKLHQIFLRNAMLYLVFLPGAYDIILLLRAYDQTTSTSLQFLIMSGISVLAAIELIFAVSLLHKFISRNSQYLYDRISHIQIKSTVHS